MTRAWLTVRAIRAVRCRGSLVLQTSRDLGLCGSLISRLGRKIRTVLHNLDIKLVFLKDGLIIVIILVILEAVKLYRIYVRRRPARQIPTIDQHTATSPNPSPEGRHASARLFI